MDEVATVLRVYSRYLHDRLSEGAIVRLLKNEQLPSEFGRPLTEHMIKTLPTNVESCVTLAYGRKSCQRTTPR